MDTQWVVQSNLGSHDDVERIAQACAALGLQCIQVQSIPFSSELPDVPEGQPTVFYGSTRFVFNAWRSRRWTPCAFHDEEAFRVSRAQAAWGARMFNAQARLTTLGPLAAEPWPASRAFFLRPDGDHKEFAGQVMQMGELRDWVARLEPGGFEFDLATPVVVAEPVEIDYEWRLFLVDGRAVAASHYRASGRLSIQADAPAEVIAFAEEAAARWSPAPAFVLDVASAAGRLGVLEVNGMNSSGFYACSIPAVVESVSRLAERLCRQAGSA